MLHSNDPLRSNESLNNMTARTNERKEYQQANFWNPNYVENDNLSQTKIAIPIPPDQPSVHIYSQQIQHHQQQQPLQNQNSQPHFNNPWGTGDAGSTVKQILQPQQVFESQNYRPVGDLTEDQIENYKRRKSSLIIPPTRAAAPNLFEYNKPDLITSNHYNLTINNDPNFRRNSVAATFSNYTGSSAVNVNSTNMIQQQQRQALFSKQQQQQQQLNNRFVPSLYNSQEYQRRQSLATNMYSDNHSNISITKNNNNMMYANNSGTANLNPSLYNNNNSHSSIYNTPINYSGVASTPSISPFRRSSAYLTSTGLVTFQPPLKQIRKEDIFQKQQLVIPQMRRCITKHDLKPIVNDKPRYRRASVHSQAISPLRGLTKNLITTYQLCSPDFVYQTSKNPKRVLTKPSEPKYNGGYDNVNSDYILYVNDVLGTEQNRKYLVLDILGQGTFGQVVKCQNLLTKEILAVKVIKSRSEYLNQSITEAKILELLNKKIDPNNEHHFLRMHDSFVHKNHLCLVFELLSNNLYELLKQNQYHGLSIQLIKIFTKQMLDSLCVLKDSKLIHCDLKPENVLLCSPDKPDIKVIDFGSSCEENRTVYTYIQSRFYRAPEIILGIPYSTSIDMWSLGCIVAELFLGIPIFPGSSEFNQITRIVETLSYPPNWMLEMGRNTSKFMVKLNQDETCNIGRKYKLKTVEEFNNDFKDANEKPGKQYFKWSKLNDIVMNYRIPKHIQHSNELIRQELKQRECLIHFLNGLLNINPLERWTPQQASLHPFLTEQPFNGDWYPPGYLPSITKGFQGNSHNSNGKNNNTVNPSTHGSNISKLQIPNDVVDTEMSDSRNDVFNDTEVGITTNSMKFNEAIDIENDNITTAIHTNSHKINTNACKLEGQPARSLLSAPEGATQKFNDLTIKED